MCLNRIHHWIHPYRTVHIAEVPGRRIGFLLCMFYSVCKLSESVESQNDLLWERPEPVAHSRCSAFLHWEWLIGLRSVLRGNSHQSAAVSSSSSFLPIMFFVVIKSIAVFSTFHPFSVIWPIFLVPTPASSDHRKRLSKVYWALFRCSFFVLTMTHRNYRQTSWLCISPVWSSGTEKYVDY